MSTKTTLRRAIEAWPESVPLRSVQVSQDDRPEAKSSSRTTPAQAKVLRAAGWESSSAGWWTYRGTA